jgi:hypothetical protein
MFRRENGMAREGRKVSLERPVRCDFGHVLVEMMDEFRSGPNNICTEYEWYTIRQDVPSHLEAISRSGIQ